MMAAGGAWRLWLWAGAWLGVWAIELPHHITMDTGFDVFWGFDTGEGLITFAVEAQTRGWVGLGLTHSGDMTGADMVVGWVKDGQPYFHDRYGVGNQQPLIDKSQDCTLVSLTQNGTHTRLEYRRPFRTCDTNDLDITEDTLRLIYACSSSVPSTPDDLPEHGVYGMKSAQILNYARREVPEPASSSSFDILTNVTIPAVRTFYACHLAKFPDFGGKVHVYKVEPIISTQAANFVHHTLLYLCPAGYDDSNLTPPTDCYGSISLAFLFMFCAEIMTGWAVGGNEMIYYPEEAGFSLGSADDPKYYVLQIHFDNPSNIAGIQDFSGFRLHYTSDLRTYDVGILWTGVNVGVSQLIPPHVTDFKSFGYCPITASPQSISTPLNFFGGILHTHLLGAKVRVLHFRNGNLLQILLEDKYYDFNLQEWRDLEKFVTVLQDDILITECTYNSMTRNTITTGGLATINEMCLAFLTYYPRIDLVSCMSEAKLESLAIKLNVTSSTSAELYQTLSQWNWTQTLGKDFEAKLLSSAQIATIVTRTGVNNVTVNIPSIPPERVPPCVRAQTSVSPRFMGRPVSFMLALLIAWAGGSY